MLKKRRAIDPNELSWTQLAKHDPELLRQKLEDRLAKPVDVDQLAREIRHILKSLGTRPGSVETVAHHIATRLGSRFSHLSVTLERLIANRPAELAEALDASDRDEYSKVAETISRLPKPKKTRARRLTEEQRRKGRRNSKNRYEKRKRQGLLRYHETGLIEQAFAIRKGAFLLSDALNRRPPTGPYLDGSVEVRLRADVGRNVLPGIFARNGSPQFSQVSASRSAQPTYSLRHPRSHYVHCDASRKRQMASGNQSANPRADRYNSARQRYRAAESRSDSRANLPPIPHLIRVFRGFGYCRLWR
jgi:hypothetical protein